MYAHDKILGTLKGQQICENLPKLLKILTDHGFPPYIWCFMSVLSAQFPVSKTLLTEPHQFTQSVPVDVAFAISFSNYTNDTRWLFKFIFTHD